MRVRAPAPVTPRGITYCRRMACAAATRAASTPTDRMIDEVCPLTKRSMLARTWHSHQAVHKLSQNIALHKHGGASKLFHRPAVVARHVWPRGRHDALQQTHTPAQCAHTLTTGPAGGCAVVWVQDGGYLPWASVMGPPHMPI